MGLLELISKLEDKSEELRHSNQAAVSDAKELKQSIVEHADNIELLEDTVREMQQTIQDE